MSAAIEQEQRGEVLCLTLNRPERLNALDRELLQALAALLKERSVAPGCRVLLLRGAGKGFVAGADIHSMHGLGAAEGRAYVELGHRVFDALEALPVPVIAAVHGFALGGGCELALACDLIVAEEGAVFGQPEVRLGLIPGFGATQRLAARIGVGRARELMLTGRRVQAEEALAMGLVDGLAPAGQLDTLVEERCRALCAGGPQALTTLKALLRAQQELGAVPARASEVEAFSTCFGGDETNEGVAAFIEKRKPSWSTG